VSSDREIIERTPKSRAARNHASLAQPRAGETLTSANWGPTRSLSPIAMHFRAATKPLDVAVLRRIRLTKLPGSSKAWFPGRHAAWGCCQCPGKFGLGVYASGPLSHAHVVRWVSPGIQYSLSNCIGLSYLQRLRASFTSVISRFGPR
jgi:hypothetical protein